MHYSIRLSLPQSSLAIRELAYVIRELAYVKERIKSMHTKFAD